MFIIIVKYQATAEFRRRPELKLYIRLIVSIYPTVNSSIPLYTTSITITFNQDVVPSVANITIYQRTNTSDNLRQTLSANSSAVHFITRREISIDVLPSTFNQEGANYFITIDPNFVMLRLPDEPLPGVSNGTWSFFTENVTNTFTENTDVAIRLTEEATTRFERLNVTAKSAYYDELITSFANAISVNTTRLSMQRRYQHDGSSKEPWPILFRVTLIAAQGSNEISTQGMYESLRVLVTNKSITSLMFYESTASLDSEFGVMQLSHDVPVLFLPSLLIILVGICVNFFITMFIFFKEFYGNDNFHNWARQNVVASSVFIVLSYCDIEALDFVSSDISNSSCVQAPFSEGVYEAMYICTLFVMLIEDIPQFIILVLYLQRVVIFRFIPLITIFTCALIIVTNIVSHIYDCVVMVRDSRKADLSKKAYKGWWQVGKASASKRISSRKHPHFLSGFVPVQPGPVIQVTTPEASTGIISEEIPDEEEADENLGAGVG
ncbi:12641_t:CDS:2, partial [Cetraspora pellucida]